jgi:hypothetical protein
VTYLVTIPKPETYQTEVVTVKADQFQHTQIYFGEGKYERNGITFFKNGGKRFETIPVAWFPQVLSITNKGEKA